MPTGWCRCLSICCATRCWRSPGGADCGASRRCLQRSGQNWISCTVLDDGPGIPAHVLPNLFEAFVTTRLDARGTGLGLTVAEGIVTQHGGTISASNRPEGGASLEVVLPAAPATHRMSERSSLRSRIVDVAVLDDDLDFRNYIEDLLRDEGTIRYEAFANPDELFHLG